MFINIILSALAAGALATSAPAPSPLAPQPAGVSLARLVTPLASGLDPVLDGRIWHCDGGECRASAFATASGRSLERQCASVARKVGPVESYQLGSESLGDDALARCNAQARGR